MNFRNSRLPFTESGLNIVDKQHIFVAIANDHEVLEFIVRACNSHDTIIETLKTIVDECSRGKVTMFDQYIIKIANVAIAEVEGAK